MMERSPVLAELDEDGLRAEYVRWHTQLASGRKSAAARLVLIETHARRRGIDLGASHPTEPVG